MSTVPEVSADDGAARVDAGAYLLDVREADEWEAGHAPRATWLPLGELVARVDEVPADTTIVVICRSGGRSAQATEFLCANGRDAVNLVGGMRAWNAAGLPVHTATGGHGTVI